MTEGTHCGWAMESKAWAACQVGVWIDRSIVPSEDEVPQFIVG